MYVVLYDQAGRLSFDKRISAKQLKNNHNDIYSKDKGSMIDYEDKI